MARYKDRYIPIDPSVRESSFLQSSAPSSSFSGVERTAEDRWFFLLFIIGNQERKYNKCLAWTGERNAHAVRPIHQFSVIVRPFMARTGQMMFGHGQKSIIAAAVVRLGILMPRDSAGGFLFFLLIFITCENRSATDGRFSNRI